MTTAAIISSVIFVVTFIFILTERVHRTVVAFAGAVIMVLTGIAFDFYGPEEALMSIDFNTIGLLFGMMIVVAIFEKTGVFQYLGILTAQKTKGNPWLLVAALGTLTTLLSFILDNVTTIILIVPVTIIIARLLEINPVPILMAEALLSDTGGVATLVGDPPNIMIGSAAGFSFNDFLIYSLPVVFVAWLATLITLKLVYRKELKEKPKNIEKLAEMNPNDAITDWRTLKLTLAVLGVIVVLFFVHHALHLEASIITLLGAALLLLLVAPTKDPQKTLEKVELSVLLFFAALFVIVGGLEHSGVLANLAGLITAGAHDNVLLTALVVLWATAILSAVVDNIPMTVAMIPIISYLGTQGVDIGILWWALAWGVGFGGNGSPIGSTANVVVVAKSEQTDTPITFKSWLKAGTSTMLVSLLVATGAIIILEEFLQSSHSVEASTIETTVEAHDTELPAPTQEHE